MTYILYNNLFVTSKSLVDSVDVICYREFSFLPLQGLHERFTDVVIASGSSGSVTGLAIANYLTGSKLR